MRSFVALAFVVAACLAAPASATATALRLDNALLGAVGASLQRAQGTAALPVLDVVAAQTSNPAPPARSLPPQLTGVGLGLQVGSPTSLTLKFAGLQQNGFVVGVGSGFANSGRFLPNLSLHVDYLFHVATLVRNADVALTAYVGPGLWLALGAYGYGFGNYQYGLYPFPLGIGVRVPMGLSMAFNAAPVELYLELDPALFIVPPADFGVGASLGFRYHF